MKPTGKVKSGLIKFVEFVEPNIHIVFLIELHINTSINLSNLFLECLVNIDEED